MKIGKMLIAIAGATVLLGALVGTASAGKLSTSSQPVRASFARLRFTGVFGEIACAITLEGSFHQRTVAKSSGNLVGLVTRAALGTCEAGSVTILSETLPWHVRYSSFTGTLPNITAIGASVVGLAFRVREPLITCLATSTAEAPMTITFNREASGALTTAVASGTNLPTSCGVGGSFSSDAGPITVLGAATRVTVTLI